MYEARVSKDDTLKLDVSPLLTRGLAHIALAFLFSRLDLYNLEVGEKGKRGNF